VRRKTTRAEVELGFAGLALLRSLPGWEARGPLVREVIEKLHEEGWADYEIEIEELDTEAGYRLWAETYDSRPNPLVEMEEPIVRSMIDRLPPGIAVDAACGTGRQAAYLEQHGHHVIAVDASDAMLAKARQRVPSAEIRPGNLTNLPVADAGADLAICTLALTHSQDLERPIAELARVVRHGGRVILSDVHPVAVVTGAQAFFRSADGARAFVQNYVHWPSHYLKEFRKTSLLVLDCREPEMDQATVERLAPASTTRHWLRQALLGLPFALIWELERE
jgi:ubiquinone/menaquinone biosynthesis C-methylase UbiE